MKEEWNEIIQLFKEEGWTMLNIAMYSVLCVLFFALVIVIAGVLNL